MPKLYNYFIVFIALLISSNAIGQSEIYIFTNKSKMLDNPAFAGFDGGYSARITHKRQWKNFNSQYLLFSGAITDRVGVGLSINKEEIFVQKDLSLFADFSYNIPVNETDKLYFGIKAGGEFRNVDASELRVYNENGRVLDDYLLQSYSDKFQPNVGVGIQYKAPKFFVGIGVPKLFTSEKVELDGLNKIVRLADQFKISLLGGYFWDINDKFSLNPYAKVIYTKNQREEIEIASTLAYNQFFEVGISYRIEESFSGFMLVNIPNTRFQLGYGYQMYTSDLSNYVTGSHEFMIQYKF